MPAHTRRPLRRGFQILVAACAVLGIGAVATTAAWTDQAKFEAKSTVAAFQMEYSYNTAEWHSFPDKTLTLTQWSGWIKRTDDAKTHSIFIRNIASATRVTFEPVLEGVFADDAGFITIATGYNTVTPVLQPWTGGPVDVPITPGQEARIDLSFNPSQLEPSTVSRTGSLTLTVTGTVGEEAPTGAPARGASDQGIAAPVVFTPPRWEWT